MIAEFGLLELIKVYSYNCSVWIIVLLAAGSYFYINKYAAVGFYLLVDIFSNVFPLFQDMPVMHLLLLIFKAYSFAFLIRENRANVLTLTFSSMYILNIVPNFIIAAGYLILSMLRGEGKWLDTNTVNDDYRVFMIFVTFIGLAFSLLFMKWMKEFILGMKGKLKKAMFFSVPVTTIISGLVKNSDVAAYRANPSGFYLYVDAAAMIICSIGVVVMIALKVKSARMMNHEIEEHLRVLQKEYESIAGVENELRTIKHELKNSIIDREM